MENYIEQIEKYLRGQMSQKEEDKFKTTLKQNAQLRLYAFIVGYILKISDVTSDKVVEPM